jgi:hypothetical protein
MRPELQAYLDGEIGWDELPAELRLEAERWERALADMKRIDPPVAPAGLERAIFDVLTSRGRRRAWQRAVDWAVRPRQIRVSPLAGLAAAAAIALLFVLSTQRGPAPEPAGVEETIFVQFTLEAPQATSVAIAGDFNEWEPEIYLEDPDGDGVWTGRIPMRPGVHHYMFVIDGSKWQTDPRAERYTDDGFGNRNAVLVVPRLTSQS